MVVSAFEPEPTVGAVVVDVIEPGPMEAVERLVTTAAAVVVLLVLAVLDGADE